MVEKQTQCLLKAVKGCCCVCRWRLTNCSHPDTDGGRIMQPRGYVCIAFAFMEGERVCFSGWGEHGMCELFKRLDNEVDSDIM